MIEVELIKPHTHAGQALAAGECVLLTLQDAEFLKKTGTAKPKQAAAKQEKGVKNGTRV